MLRDPAAKRYAQAGFELARDRDELEAWERDLGAFGDATSSDEALGFLDSRKVTEAAKLGFLQRVVERPAPLVWNLVQLLARKGRLVLLPQVAEHFQTLLNEQRGIAHAQVLTAVPLSDDDREALITRLADLTGKQVIVQTFEEPSIIGGLVARIGDRLIDGSTRSKLLALKRELAGTH